MPNKNEFEILRFFEESRYTDRDSPVHRTDPRVKLFACALLVAAAVSLTGVLSLLALLLSLFSAIGFSRMKLRTAFSPLIPVLPFVMVLSLFQLFAIPEFRDGAFLLWRWSVFQLTDRSLKAGVLLILRFAVIVLAFGLLSYSTRTSELMLGIEQLLRPLQKLRFPAHEFALTINISIRFLPILVSETERLMKAQASRGADFGLGTRSRRKERNYRKLSMGFTRLKFIRRLKRMLPLLVPIFLISLNRAENLIQAMEARCYEGGRGRSSLHPLKMATRDWGALLLTTGIGAGVFILNYSYVERAFWEITAAWLSGL